MRRLIVLRLPPQLVFPDAAVSLLSVCVDNVHARSTISNGREPESCLV
jgi:hypothetical protein